MKFYFSCGVRHNGDVYGVSIFTCQKCDFKTSFHCDKASERYYYETSYWNCADVISQWGKKEPKEQNV
jgi:hypothetical protein